MGESKPGSTETPSLPTHNEVFDKAVGQCPVVGVKIGGVPVSALVDTGSEVTTITENFFNKHFSQQGLLSTNTWLKLTAANGLDIPYVGYFEADVECCGKLIEKRGILVVQDPPNASSQRRKAAVPGLLGMNVIGKCQDILKQNFGSCYMEQMTTEWRDVFQAVTHSALSVAGLAKIAGRSGVRVPAGSVSTVQITGWRGRPGDNDLVIVESLQGPLPGSGKLSLVPTVTQVRHGRAFIRLVNFSPEDVYLEPRTRVGVMHHVMGINSDESGLNFYQGSSNEVHIRPADKAVHGGEGRNQGKQVSIPVDLSDIECSIKEKDQLSKLLQNHAHLFVDDDDDLGYTDRVKHQIHTVNDVPVNQPYRRIPPSEYQSVKNHIQKLLDKQIIRESYSPYASPIVVVKKKDGSMRLCVDYRKLNQKTVKDAYPLPRIAESWDALKGAKYFTTLDLASGYHQVAMDENDRAKTAFTTPFGLYEYDRMPFGLCNAPATFQRLMQATMNDFIFQILLVYLDDILVYASTFQEHLERLDKVFSRLSKAGLRLKLSKCSFLRKQVTYLGHNVSADGVATDCNKISAVTNWGRPKGVRELRSFLGLCGYYRRYVRGFAQTAGPLHELINTCNREIKKKKESESIISGEMEADP